MAQVFGLLRSNAPGAIHSFKGFQVSLTYKTIPPGSLQPVEKTDRADVQGQNFSFEVPDKAVADNTQAFRFEACDIRGAPRAKRQMTGAELQMALRGRDGVILELDASEPAKPNPDHPGQIDPFRPRTDAKTRSVRGRVVIETNGGAAIEPAGYRVSARWSLKPGDLRAGEQSSAAATLQSSPEFTFAIPAQDRLNGQPLRFEARYPDGTLGGAKSVADEDLGEVVELRLPAPRTVIVSADPRIEANKPEKFKGKVVDITGRKQIAYAQVMLWSKADGGAHPIVVATTDGFGNFSGQRPKEEYAALFATVSGSSAAEPKAALPVGLEQGRVPTFILLAVEVGEDAGADDADCACDGPGAPRLPDQEDLLNNPNVYSQDIGLNCVNFTVPNRTLEEFTYAMAVRTSEPEIKGTTMSDLEQRQLQVLNFLVQSREVASEKEGTTSFNPELVQAMANIVARKADGTVDGSVIAQSFAGGKIELSFWNDFFKFFSGRAEMNAKNAADWDASPTFYQATTIAHGHLVYFKQVWKADGYSLGDLLYSLPLAPGQKKNIVIFDWGRSEAARRDEASREDEAVDAYLSHERDIQDITSGRVHERTDGGSSASTHGSAGGFGVGGGGGIFGKVTAFLGVSGGYSASGGSSSSNAWQESSRNVSAQGLNSLRDSVQQGASAVRNQRSTVIQSARQAERFKVETQTVANYNHCHAITMEYFEVLRHYAVEQEVSHVQECLFIPLLMSEFDEPKVGRWLEPLRRALRDPRGRSVFRLAGGGIAVREKPLSDAFDAIERRLNGYEGSDLPDTNYAAEQIGEISGDLSITLVLNRPVDPSAEEGKSEKERAIDKALWGTFVNILGFAPWTRLEGQIQLERDRIFETELAPQIAEGFVQSLRFKAIDAQGTGHDLPLETTLITPYARGVPLYVAIRPTQAQMPLRRDQISAIVIYTAFDLSQSAKSKIVVRSGTFRYRTPHFHGILYRNDSINNDLKTATIFPGQGIPTDAVLLNTPLTTEELRNPRKEDADLARKLLRHLNANIEYYHRAIWQGMDPSRRYMLLDGFLAPNAGGKSVASVVENRVIGIAGNALIMPVAPGYKLDPSYEFKPRFDVDGKPVRDEQGAIVYEEADLLARYQPLTPVPPFRVSVPTRGVFAEAVMGACNSCEKKDETRFWRWEESPLPDQPPSVSPVETRPPERADPGNVTPTPYPTPLVSIQTVPAAPEPGSTLAGALNLLGKSELFKDITGLEQNQKNAATAMTSNQDAAKHYADKAAELAMQAASVKHSPSTIDQIKQAMADKQIDEATGKRLIEQVLQTQISGAPKKDPAPPDPFDTAVVKNLENGNFETATKKRSDGTETTIKGKAAPKAEDAKPGGGSGSKDTPPQDKPAPDDAAGIGDVTIPASYEELGGDIQLVALKLDDAKTHALLTASVAAFKAIFKANPEMVTTGQFPVCAAVKRKLVADVDAELAARPNPALEAIWDKIKPAPGSLIPISGDELLAELARQGAAANYPVITRVFSNDPSATEKWAQLLAAQYWTGSAVNTLADVGVATAAKWNIAYEKGGFVLPKRDPGNSGKTILSPTGEKGGCYYSTVAMTRRVLAARKTGALPRRAQISLDKIANAALSDEGKTIKYSSVQAVQSVVDKMKATLDAHGVIICGLLSGTEHDTTNFPVPEHYVLVFGYDDNAFVFWDSDSPASNIAALGWGTGFGVLFWDGTRLSTAFDEKDFAAIGEWGDHTNFTQRHRYQVYSVQTYPLP
ncbi:hypothetical protein [Sorangium sp. So ce1151]|uniref:hypothetical protein n=1 Tax=Sorangium sp. So ce1151 TaxID=3133332 RepID=UPI003F636BF6